MHEEEDEEEDLQEADHDADLVIEEEPLILQSIGCQMT